MGMGGIGRLGLRVSRALSLVMFKSIISFYGWTIATHWVED